MNKVILTGYFYPPKDGLTPEGTKYMHFSLGVQKPLRDKASGKFEQQFVNCTVLSEFIMKPIRQYAAKGMKVSISGKLDIGTYNDKPTVAVLVDEFNFEEPRKVYEYRSGANAQQPQASASTTGNADNAFMPDNAGGDEMPFN